MKKRRLFLWIIGFAITLALAVYAVRPLQQAARSFLLTETPVLLSLEAGHSFSL